MSSALVASKKDAPNEMRKTKDSTFDRIWKFYHEKTNVILTAKEEEIRERWEHGWFLLCGHKNMKTACEMIVETYSVKKSIAYDDLRNAMLLFSDPRMHLKDAKKAIAETMILAGAEKAWDKGDLFMHEKYLNQYVKINGLENKDGDNIADLIKKLKPHVINFVTDESELKKEAAQLMKNIPAEDIDFEQVDEGNTD